MWEKTICNGKVTFTIDICKTITDNYVFQLIHENGETERLVSMPSFQTYQKALDYIRKRPEWREKTTK